MMKLNQIQSKISFWFSCIQLIKIILKINSSIQIIYWIIQSNKYYHWNQFWFDINNNDSYFFHLSKYQRNLIIFSINKDFIINILELFKTRNHSKFYIFNNNLIDNNDRLLIITFYFNELVNWVDNKINH